MLRALFAAQKLLLRPQIPTLCRNAPSKLPTAATVSNFTTLAVPQNGAHTLLSHPRLQAISDDITRNITKFTLSHGKRRSCKDVVMRFYRLNWGGWIRGRAGRNRRLWQKSPPRKRRLRQHVLCNATQSTLLDKMVGVYWRRPKYYVDDPYEPYHSREEFQCTYTKPKPYFPPEK